MSILATPEPWNAVSIGYVKTTMEFLTPFSQMVLQKAKLSKDMHILDVACGPGTLSLQAAHLVENIEALDFSESMLELFQSKVAESSSQNIQLHHGDGQALPFAEERFDRCFSMFGLMFFPDKAKGLREMHRTLRSRGKAFVTSWLPMSDSIGMQLFFGAMQAIDPTIPEPPAISNPLESPEYFQDEMENAGFVDVTISKLEQTFTINSAQEFWETMTLGNAPVVMLRKKMGEELWLQQQPKALAYLQNKLTDLPLKTPFNAWLASGEKI